MNELIEGHHYYLNEKGFVVLTETYHLERGFCCGKGCLHCPYEYRNVPEPEKILLQTKKKQEKSGSK